MPISRILPSLNWEPPNHEDSLELAAVKIRRAARWIDRHVACRVYFERCDWCREWTVFRRPGNLSCTRRACVLMRKVLRTTPAYRVWFKTCEWCGELFATQRINTKTCPVTKSGAFRRRSGSSGHCGQSKCSYMKDLKSDRHSSSWLRLHQPKEYAKLLERGRQRNKINTELNKVNCRYRADELRAVFGPEWYKHTLKDIPGRKYGTKKYHDNGDPI